jgi:O-antigen ligase
METPLPANDSAAPQPKALTKRLAWLPASALGVFAIFAWLPDSYFRMVGWPWAMIWQVGFLAVGVGLIYQLRTFQQPFTRLGYGLDWAILALAGSMVISGALSSFPALAAQNIVLAASYLLVLYALRNTKLPWLQYRRLWAYLVIVGCIAAIVGLAMWRPNADMWLSTDFYASLRNRFPLGHHNFSGGYFVLLLPLAVSAAVAQRGVLRWLSGVASLMIAIALYATGSRGALLGVMAITIASLGVMLWRSRGPQRRRALALTGVALCMIATLLFSNPRIRTMLAIQQIQSESATTVAVTVDSPTRDRFFMAEAALNILQARPLIGVGPGNMIRVYSLYRPIETGAGLDQVQQLHNMPLQILGELGLLGFTAYLFGLGCLVRLWWWVLRQVKEPLDRTLTYAVGASFLGYSVSSLTDYQLENLPIGGTLTLLTVMLIGLADRHIDSLIPPVAKQYRRVSSLLILGLMGLSLQFWVRLDLSLWLTNRALQSIDRDDFVQADQRFSTAAQLLPWDPTPSYLAAQVISQAAQVSKEDSQTQKVLEEVVVQHYETALQTAPYDFKLLNNLALSTLLLDIQKAETYAAQSLQLMPRTIGYRYYTLGLTYLSQGKQPAAITTFALEALANPNFVTMSLWDQPPLESLKPEFAAKTVSFYESVLDRLSPTSLFYNTFDEQTQLIRWWLGEPVTGVDFKRLRPIVAAVLNADTEPDRAMTFIETCLQADPTNDACQVMQAWMQPDQYLEAYLAAADISDLEKRNIKQHINTFREIKPWLRSLHEPPSEIRQDGLAMAYRNAFANEIFLFSQLPDLQESLLARNLGLFAAQPRELPVLDDFMEEVRARDLQLPHPTRTNFKLVSQ